MMDQNAHSKKTSGKTPIEQDNNYRGRPRLKRKCSPIREQHGIEKEDSKNDKTRKRAKKSEETGKLDNPDQKRPCISWDQYFMGVAFMASQVSKDPVTQVGSCIVNNEKRIISTGHNGMPNRCSDDIMPWGKRAKMKNKHLYVCHSEMNAILNKISSDVRGATLYVTLYPCNNCAKTIIQAGIKTIVFYEDDRHPDSNETKAAKTMFAVAGIEIRKYQPSKLPLKIGTFQRKL